MQPTAVILLKEIADDVAAGGIVGLDSDELGAFVGGAHGAFGQQTPDVIGLLVVRTLHRLPNLLLALVVRIDRKRH